MRRLQFLVLFLLVPCALAYFQVGAHANWTTTRSAMAASVSGGPKLVVITGATRGLGSALADELLRLGHSVAGCGRSEEGVRARRAAHADAVKAGRARWDVVDVSDASQVQAWAADVVLGSSTPDVVVANAAMILHPAPLWEVEAEAMDAILRTNVGGVANVARAFLPLMIKATAGPGAAGGAAGAGGSGGGVGAGAGAGAVAVAKSSVFVALSSYWGRQVSAGVAPYCATKYGVEGLTAALAEDLRNPKNYPPSSSSSSPSSSAGGGGGAAKRVAAVALNPGVIHTDMLEVAIGKDRAAQHGSPKEWAAAAAPYLLGMGPGDNGKSVTVPGY